MTLSLRAAGLAVLSITFFVLTACRAGQSAPVMPVIDLPTPEPVVTPAVAASGVAIPGETLRAAATVEQLELVIAPSRDLADLTERTNPDVGDIPAVASAIAPDYQVGDRIQFWVHNVDAAANFTTTAELIHKTDVAYAWVEADQPHDNRSIRRSIDRFSTRIYPAARAAFGSEWTPGVDGDPRLHILHTTGMGGGVAGYFSGADENNKLAFPFSNEKEMFYISLDWLNSSRDYTMYETVLAHEFQHMIHWANDRNEEVWLNEGLSEYAQEVAGYPPDTVFATAFLMAPDTQLNSWGEATSNNTPHYGAAYLFVRYLTQRFGPQLTRDLVTATANGIAGVNLVLENHGAKIDFDALFADWVVANYADGRAIDQDKVHSYTDLNLRIPSSALTMDAYPADTGQAAVANYAADYIDLQGAGAITVTFQGAAMTRLAAAEPNAGELAWWSNRTDDSDTRLTRRFDLSDVDASTPVTLAVSMWWDIEQDYDYGYVMASKDGVNWQMLPGQRSTMDNPSGINLGVGYTGSSGAVDSAFVPTWRTEIFDLSDYRGGDLWLRFEYVTDDAVNRPGWLIDDAAIPAIGYDADFARDASGWESEGWLLTDNQLEQRWLVQVLEFEGDRLMDVRRIDVGADGAAAFPVDNTDGRSAVLAVSGLTPVTTEPAEYSVQIALGNTSK
jgi:hypothetical protein